MYNMHKGHTYPRGDPNLLAIDTDKKPRNPKIYKL